MAEKIKIVASVAAFAKRSLASWGLTLLKALSPNKKFLTVTAQLRWMQIVEADLGEALEIRGNFGHKLPVVKLERKKALTDFEFFTIERAEDGNYVGKFREGVCGRDTHVHYEKVGVA